MPGSRSAQRILVVDDDDFIRRFLGDFLTRRGYVVDPVPNGSEALEKASMGVYSLFILDLEMGHPTGLEVIRRLRSAGNQTPIILMSGSFVEGTPEGVPGGGEMTCIAKPFTGAELEAKIQELID